MSKFDLRKRIATVVPPWLRQLEERKGDRAALRRAQQGADVYAIELAHRLADQLDLGREESDAPFFLAALLAHVREPQARPLIVNLAETASNGKPEDGKLKPQRFARLLQANDLPDRLRLFRRALQLVDGRADVINLSYIFLTWAENATKREFARVYYAPRSLHDAGDDAVAATSSTDA
ncbi:type I-E CRISPR-associated protein Cse2/CasB [Tahibacter sp.]|uniref:type I-E CRISPR-associated protein Cse2/CasB n=1 Tax=Tahibacter sp. TaxID=2056211 RepID=UPI0028C4F855|nr:type I-E CRISPR-associated protein Cse2/CasB [Tahibacter sp.]